MDSEQEDALAFDANEAIAASRAMWLKLGRYLAAVMDGLDWIDTPVQAARAMEFAAQAEACFWRATGEEDCASAAQWVPALATRAKPTDPIEGEG